MIPPDDAATSDRLCWETCVAAIMERTAGSVVDVHIIDWEAEERPWEWWGVFLDWLWGQGWKVSQVIPDERPDGIVIATGPSPRIPGGRHAVVLQDGTLAFDPCVSDPTGLDTYDAFYRLEPV